MIPTRCTCGHVEDIPPIRAHLTDLVTAWTITWTCHEPGCDRINTATVTPAALDAYRAGGVPELRLTTAVHTARQAHLDRFTEDEAINLMRAIHNLTNLAHLAARPLEARHV